MIITIDGPAGSGKSTAAALLAQRLGIAYLDTGAMYRAVTLAVLKSGIRWDDSPALEKLAAQTQIDLVYQNAVTRVYLDGLDVTEEIRKPQVTDHAHYIAGSPAIRDILVRRQREIAQKTGSLVTEGRDQGTVAFPGADFKFYLDASPGCRAQRRCLELSQKGLFVELDQILTAQQQRDARDQQRSVGPLVPAADAMVIDTTDLTIEQVVDILCRHIQQETRR